MKLVYRLFQLVIFSALMSSAAAHAQAARKPVSVSSTLVDAARKHYEQGVKYEKAGQLALAYSEYAAAYNLYNHWQIAGTLGSAALKLGKNIEAAESISQFLREGQNVLASEREDMEKQLATAKSQVGALAFETAAGSEVFVDGKSLGKVPFKKDTLVEPGSHTIEAKKAGVNANATVYVGAGKREVVKLRYGPVAEPVEVSPSSTPTATTTATGPVQPAPTITASTTGKTSAIFKEASIPIRTIALGGGIALTVVSAAVGIPVGASAVDAFNKLESSRSQLDKTKLEQFRNPRLYLSPINKLVPISKSAWGQLDNQHFYLSNTAGLCIVSGLAGLAVIGGALLWPAAKRSTATIQIRSAGLGGEISIAW